MTNTLEYSNAGRGRRRWGRWVLVALVVATLGTLAYYREPVWRKARVLYWQRQCMKYTRPAGTPVLVTPAVGVGDKDYVPPTGFPGGHSLVPTCWRELEAASSVMPAVAYSRGQVPPVVFLHERTSPAGHRRLVRVECVADNALQLPRGLTFAVYEPATLRRELKEVSPRYGLAMSGRYVRANLFFGQVDPDDASHFTIEFTADGRRAVIDGYLRDDETVDLKLRDPGAMKGVR